MYRECFVPVTIFVGNVRRMTFRSSCGFFLTTVLAHTNKHGGSLHCNDVKKSFDDGFDVLPCFDIFSENETNKVTRQGASTSHFRSLPLHQVSTEFHVSVDG